MCQRSTMHVEFRVLRTSCSGFFRVSHRVQISLLHRDRFFLVRNVRDAEWRNNANARISIIFFCNDYVINKCVNNQRVFPRTVFEIVLAKLLSRDDNSLGFLCENQAKKLCVSLSVDEVTHTIDYRKTPRNALLPSFICDRHFCVADK